MITTTLYRFFAPIIALCRLFKKKRLNFVRQIKVVYRFAGKKKKIRINVEEIRALDARRREINAINIRDIEWYENGKKLNYTEEQVNQWRFIGLCNTSFVEFYHDHYERAVVMTYTPTASTRGSAHSCDIAGCAVCDPTEGL